MAIGSGGGSGVRVGDVRMGGAYYEVFAKDKLTPELEKMEKKARSFDTALKSVGKAGVGAGVDALKAGFIALGAVAFKAFAGQVTGLEKVRKELTETAKIIEQTNALMDRNIATRAEGIDAALDPAEKLKKVEQELAKLEREKKDAIQSRMSLEAASKRNTIFGDNGAAGFGDRVNSLGLFVSGGVGGAGLEDAQEAARKNIEGTEAAVAKLHNRMLDLSALRSKLIAEQKAMVGKNVGMIGAALFGGSSEAGVKFVAELNEVTAALKHQADTWGLTADEIAVFDLKAKGFTDEALAGVKAEMGRMKILGALGGAAGALASGVQATEAMAVAESVRGGFNASALGQQFGVGSEVTKQTDLLKQLNDGRGKLPERIGEHVRDATTGLFTIR